jgi:GNAT superfamily N-acetyltransferase
MDRTNYRLRKAVASDRDAVIRMQERSARTLGRAFYAAESIESALRHIGTMDPDVIDEGHFYVAVDAQGRIVGSGGWSRRIPDYDGGHANPTVAGPCPNGTVFIRGVYVDPDWARCGVATTIMARAEADVASFGVPELVLTATLSGVPLYRALRYRALRPKVLHFPDGNKFEALEMKKRLVGAQEIGGLTRKQA